MVVLESLAAIVDNLEKELVCFRMHVPLFSELLTEISRVRDVNVDLNVVSEVLLGMLDHMQKHLTGCWKLLQDFYKKVAHSNLSGQIFGESEVGQMPEELLEMLSSMTEHMVRFRRVCESRLKGQHCRGHCNSGYSRSLHLALACSATTTDQAKKLVRPVSVRVLRLSSQDLDTNFGVRCRLDSNSVTKLREELKLGEMEALQRRISRAARLLYKRRKAQLRSQHQLRLQQHRIKVDSRRKQTVAKMNLPKSVEPKISQELPPYRVTRRSVALAAEMEPLHDVTPGEPALQPDGPSPARVVLRASESIFSPPLRRLYATRLSTERIGRLPSSADRNASGRCSSSGSKGKRQLVPSTSNSAIGNKRRKSDTREAPSRRKVRGLSLDGDTNSIPRRPLRKESLDGSLNKRKLLNLNRRIPTSQDQSGNSSSFFSPPLPSVALSKSSPFRNGAVKNSILNSSRKRRVEVTRSSRIAFRKLKTSS